mmetsp:Transcript_42518/g.113823  ORF Transcript_42518/g.113823 Transcript_42518/m.113823 type:complete len:197 (-) Transcript_42518:2-592(-)
MRSDAGSPKNALRASLPSARVGLCIALGFALIIALVGNFAPRQASERAEFEQGFVSLLDITGNPSLQIELDASGAPGQLQNTGIVEPVEVVGRLFSVDPDSARQPLSTVISTENAQFNGVEQLGPGAYPSVAPLSRSDRSYQFMRSTDAPRPAALQTAMQKIALQSSLIAQLKVELSRTQAQRPRTDALAALPPPN